MLTSINGAVAAPFPITVRTWRDRLVAVADRVHARNDAFAASMGWAVTRDGLTGRTYRDPRLDRIGGAR